MCRPWSAVRAPAIGNPRTLAASAHRGVVAIDVVTDSPSTWARLITDNFISLSISDAGEAFRASLRRCDLGDSVRLTVVGTDRSRVVRTARGVRRDGCDDVLLLAPILGPALVRQEGGETAVSPGAVSVHVAERPYELVFDRPNRVVVLQAPRRIVPSGELVSARRRLEAGGTRGAMASVFRAFATEVVAVEPGLSEREREELGHTAVELAVSVLSTSGPAPLGRRAVVAAAKAFVGERLADPDLTPETVAAAQGVSLRYLQLAFAEAGSSPGAYIRIERLRRSRRLLADPRCAGLSVAQVAHRVGYRDVNAFIRAFKRECSDTPGGWRAARRASGPERGSRW
ncbi:AraC-like DNA-binding protein [Pseudonocardia eucalypti]|nr:AraC-like DNA-binding protein [Pseudonocardia eucalypti]